MKAKKSISIVLLLGVLLSAIYIFESGLPQPGHLILLLGSGALLIKYGRTVRLDNTALALVFFVAYAVLVNLFYGFIHDSAEFFKPVVFILYNLILFFSVKALLENGLIDSSHLFFVLVAAFVIQLIALVVGFGRSIEGVRYSGTFNDPNQMGYWFVCVGAAFLLLEGRKRSPSAFKIFGACLILIYVVGVSASRSAIVGLLPLLGFSAYLIFKKTPGKHSLLIFVLVSFVSWLLVAQYGLLEDNFTLDRMLSTDIQEEAGVRGYSRVLEYPEMIILGAGEGLHERFSWTRLEIHSTWVGILFYYGIPGIFLMVVVIFMIMRKGDFSEAFLLISPLAYGISTYGLRTPIFWIMIAIFSGAGVMLAARRNNVRL